VPLAADVSVDDLALRTEGFSGADVESLCKKATLHAIADFQDERRAAPFLVHRNDFVTVLESERPVPKPD
jgi:transitional endoplasmic reticulum ATPase